VNYFLDDFKSKEGIDLRKDNAAMQRLPVQERLVLEGVTIGGARAQTMAETLGVTPAQIYRLQKNGIRRIRGMLSRFMQHW